MSSSSRTGRGSTGAQKTHSDVYYNNTANHPLGTTSRARHGTLEPVVKLAQVLQHSALCRSRVGALAGKPASARQCSASAPALHPVPAEEVVRGQSDDHITPSRACHSVRLSLSAYRSLYGKCFAVWLAETPSYQPVQVSACRVTPARPDASATRGGPARSTCRDAARATSPSLQLSALHTVA